VGKKIFLWILSLMFAISAMIYQRSTGPTYEYKGELKHIGESYKYELLRSQETTEGAKIKLPTIKSSNYSAKLHYKRYQTKDSITTQPFYFDKNKELIAQLPVQPAAGKMEYFISGNIDGKEFHIPEKGEENIILRYKDPVSNYILGPHIFFMIMVIILGIRAGLSALFDYETMRRWAIFAFSAITIGGMMLGPLVQKSAFGEYWTGFPYGGDFTDNKTLIMWIVWALALVTISLEKMKKNKNMNKFVVLIASIVMISVYLIPHSMGGSTLDYDKVDKGIDPKEAIKTGAE
jgi:hypothetical protein